MVFSGFGWPARKRADTLATEDMPQEHTPATLTETLRRHPFFAQLRPSDLRNLATASIERSYPEDAILVRQGQQPGVGLFFVLRGRVCVTQRGTDGEEREQGRLGPGEMFGEMALLDEQPRATTVTALWPTTALIIPIFDFRAALAHNPDAALWLLKLLAQRLRAAEDAAQNTAPVAAQTHPLPEPALFR